MKLITPFLVRFALAAIVLTIVFRYGLSYSIENDLSVALSISTLAYGSLMFICGWIFGIKDSNYLPILDVGFRFHLTTYMIHNAISLLWYYSGMASAKESISVPIAVAAYWGVFIVIHFVVYLIARKQSIYNLDKEDIFD